MFDRDGDRRFVGRGAQIRPANRFSSEQTRLDVESERPNTVHHPDDSQSIVTENRSPDLGFRYTVNPYRGCAHGCSYCYARPTHEYLGFDAGLDFETQIMVKHDAPRLLRAWLTRKAWQCEPIMFSGVTDCYQPAEREYQLTRACLEVALELRQPVRIVTKNALITRDLDLLELMAQRRLIHVAVSLTSLEGETTRKMEPRTSSPAARLNAIRHLSAAGVPVQVMVAPIIPALNDHELPSILQAAADHGATRAGYVVLRLPLTVAPVFFDWLERSYPNRLAAVKRRLESMRDGGISDSRFGRRMRGTGVLAEQIKNTFSLFAKRMNLLTDWPSLNCDDFVSPHKSGPHSTSDSQRRLF